MDPELLRLLLEVLRNQQTTGSAATGGDVPYDDYDVFSSIGGLGAVDPAGVGGSFDDGSIGAATMGPTRYDTSPSTVGYDAQQARIEQRRPLADLLAAMQQGVGAGAESPQIVGLFGATPSIERPKPPTPIVTPMAAPVAGSVNSPRPGTPTPDPKSDPKTLPRLTQPDKSKQIRPRTAPQEAVQQITRQAQAAQPQRQYSAPIPQQQRTFSAPAPTFTSAPASRSAPQNSLAQTLNLMRSLVRR